MSDKPAILATFIEELVGEADRHMRDGFEHGNRDIWQAQANAFGARLVSKLHEALAAEIKDILAHNDQACLHKVAAGLVDVEEHVAQLNLQIRFVLMAYLAQAESGEGEPGL